MSHPECPDIDYESMPFSLEIIQHPLKVRMCGFGDKDRRPVDPPPIVRLVHPEVPDLDALLAKCIRFIVVCQLHQANPDLPGNPAADTPMGLVSASPGDAGTSNITGGYSTSPIIMAAAGKYPRSIVFYFPDLCIRTEGIYRLSFLLFPMFGDGHISGRVPSDPSPKKPDTTPARSRVMSDVFTSYSPKNFPGMSGSSEYTRALQASGVRVTVRAGSDTSTQQEPTNSHTSDP